MKIKKLLMVALSLLMIISCVPLAVMAADGEFVVVESSVKEVKPGEKVVYTVYLDTTGIAEGAIAYNFEIGLPTNITCETVTMNNEISSVMGTLFNEYEKTDALVSVLGAGAAKGYVGKIEVATLECTVSDKAVAGEIALKLGNVKVTKPGYVELEGVAAEVAPVTVYVPHVCDLKPVAEVPATCTTEGVKAHYVCSDEACGKLYLDAEGKQVVTAAALVIPALGHDFKDGYCQREGCGYAMTLDDIIAHLTGYDKVNKVLAYEVEELADTDAKDYITAKVEENLKAILGENYNKFIKEFAVQVTSFDAAEAGKAGKVEFTLTITGVEEAGATAVPTVTVNGIVTIAALPEEEPEEVEDKKLGMIFPKLFNVKVDCGEGGSVNTSETFKMAYGSTRTIKFTADEGYEVADVIVNGKSVGAVEKYTIKGARTTYTVKVLFEEIEG